jgi:hypothetical protein
VVALSVDKTVLHRPIRVFAHSSPNNCARSCDADGRQSGVGWLEKAKGDGGRIDHFGMRVAFLER